MEYVIPGVALLLLMWLLVARGPRRRVNRQLEMQDNLRVGDEVITAGGLHGEVREADGDVLTVEIAPGTSVRVDRRAIAGVVAPDDMKDAGEAEQISPTES